MSGERLTERDTVPEPGEAQRDEQSAQLGGWPSDKPLPLLLTPADLQRVFQIAPSTYFKHREVFARFEVSLTGAGDIIGMRRYCGAKIREFLQQATAGGRTDRIFGGKRGPRVASKVSMHDEAIVARFLDRRKVQSVDGNSVDVETR